MTNLDSIFKSRDITLPTKVRPVRAMVFPVVMYGCESWTVKKAESRRIDAFKLWCWRRLSHSYMTTGKTIALTIWTFVRKVMSLLYNMLSRLVKAFLPRSKLPRRMVSPFNFMAAVTICSDFGAQENKIFHCFHFSPFCLS